MKRICVFCGSKSGTDGVYREAADRLGQLLVEAGYGVVYGGGNVGLMGVLADTVLAAGGELIGVIPDALVSRELAHRGVTEMIVVEGMHLRKARMNELSDGFIALPGGFGTLEELFEVISWSQLDIHRKPVGLLNVGGYYDPLVRLLDRAVTEGFMKVEHRDLLLVAEEPKQLLDAILRR